MVCFSAISDKRAQLADICRRFGVARLDVFGSAARSEDFDENTSDIDLLVDFATISPDPYIPLKDAFENLLGRKVDLTDRRAIENSRNFIRRRAILDKAQPIYAA